MEYFSDRRVLASLIILAIAILMIVFGHKLSKVEDDEEVQKMGKGFFNLGKFLIILGLIINLYKYVYFLMDE